MYTQTTHLIKVTVLPTYLPHHSAPEDDHFVWAYTIQMENHSQQVVQLINRYWQITDAAGHIQEVRGAGVVGQQPILRPGENYQYTSSAALHTPSGMMTGNYEFLTGEGEHMTVAVPAFSLDSPYQVKRPN